MAIVLLAAAAVLSAYAVQAFRQIQSLELPVAVSPITDPRELAARQHDVIGTFSTGTQPGDRTIIVHADGKIEFIEVGAAPEWGRIADTYRLQRRGKNFCLVTGHSGLVGVVDIDTLVYCRDTYQRPH